MPKTRNILAALAVLAATLFIGAPANAARTATGCDSAVSGWSNAKVCITVTYHQPTASQFEIDRVKVEATSISEVKRVEFTLMLWTGSDDVTWQRDGTLNPDNGWDKAYTPDGLRTGINGSRITCWGNAYFDVGGAGFFTTGAWL